MDQIDRKIIRELQGDARLTNQELSERVGLSPSPCLRRLRAMEADATITGYTALVDQTRFGLPVTVFIRISLTSHDAETVAAFERGVGETDAIMECWMTTGGSDYMLKVLVANLEAYERFVRGALHRLPGVSSIATSFAYGRVKHATVFPSVAAQVGGQVGGT